MEKSCCTKGVFYGLIPHVFCIGFIIFSIIGSVSAATIFKNFLVIPYFFQILVILSFLMATISAFFYLKRNNCLCWQGAKSKWRYLAILYATTIFVNLFMFYSVFPALANIDSKNYNFSGANLADLSLKVGIPCSGHAPLIIDELKKDAGIKNITFKMPDVFEIKYDSSQTSKDNIKSLNIFKTYKLVE